jgi:hypothetical protein
MIVQDSFLEVLPAAGRALEIPLEDDVYGWLIGGWHMDAVFHLDDGSTLPQKAEAHFAWVLEGRAVQDLWITPPREERSSAGSKGVNLYGTTVRVYDSSLRAWRVTWFNPPTGAHDELIGDWSGKDIVQEGKSASGAAIRWSFTEITADSFRWLGERLEADGETWFLQAEFRAHKVR